MDYLKALLGMTNEYPFFRKNDLPAGPCREIRLAGTGRRFAVTGDYQEPARNHCAAVCLANAMICLKTDRTVKQEERDRLFRRAYALLGNGPLFTREFRKGTGNALFEAGLPGCRLRPCGSPGEVRSCLEKGSPCAVLVMISPLNWHWVLAVGCREYEDGSFYLRICDGWNARADRWLRWGGPVRIRSVTAIEKRKAAVSL